MADERDPDLASDTEETAEAGTSRGLGVLGASDDAAVATTPAGNVRSTLKRLVAFEEQMKGLQEQGKGIRQQYRSISNEVKAHMEQNAVRIYNLDSHTVSLIKRTQFPALSPEFVYEQLTKYFNETPNPGALGATEALFEARKQMATASGRLKIRAKTR